MYSIIFNTIFNLPIQEPLSVARAKSLLERASATGHLPAVYLLVELLDREGAAVRAIELLQRQLEGTSTATAFIEEVAA